MARLVTSKTRFEAVRFVEEFFKKAKGVLYFAPDLDGTFLAFEKSTEHTKMVEPQREAYLAMAAAAKQVGYITGREIASAERSIERSGLKDVSNLKIRIGTHGTETTIENLQLLPAKVTEYVADEKNAFFELLDVAAKPFLEKYPGNLVEKKKLGNWTINTQGMAAEEKEELKKALQECLKGWRRRTFFKQGDDVLELSMFDPKKYNKGTAMLALMAFKRNLNIGQKLYFVYPGDSGTDETIHSLKETTIDEITKWKRTILEIFPLSLSGNDKTIGDFLERNDVVLFTIHVDKSDEQWRPQESSLGSEPKTSADLIVQYKDLAEVLQTLAATFNPK